MESSPPINPPRPSACFWVFLALALLLGLGRDLATGADLGSSPSQPAVSAKHIKVSNPGSASGLYWLDPDGDGGSPPFQAYCDMSVDGGGWVLALNSVAGSEATSTMITNTVGTAGLTTGHVLAVRNLALSAGIRHQILQGARVFHARYQGNYFTNLPALGNWTPLPGHTDFGFLTASFGAPLTSSAFGVPWYWNGSLTATPVNLNDAVNGPKNETGAAVDQYSVWIRELDTPPIITAQPQSLSVTSGTTAVFSISLYGNATLQWRKDGTNLPGRTSPALTIPNVQSDDAGSYTVVLSNSLGVATSAAAELTVLERPRHFSVLAGTRGGFGNADGQGTSARFRAPYGLARDASGTMYVADALNHLIRRMDPAGTVSTLAGGAGVSGTADGAGGTARFNQPTGLAMDTLGNLFVADCYNHTIRKVTPAGVVTTLAGLGGTSGTANGTGSAARFAYPIALAIDAGGNLLVADYGNHAIRRVTPAGVVTTFAGSPGSSGTANGTGTVARFNAPWGIALGTNGTIYVADSGNHTLRKITPAGVVTTHAGVAGSPGSADGVGGQFNVPAGIATDELDNVFVADFGNNRLRQVQPNGQIDTLIGFAGIGSEDGPAFAASLYAPVGLLRDSTNNFYLVEIGNHTLRRYNNLGMVTTLAGWAPHAGALDGQGGTARFFNPAGVANDREGNLYIADFEASTLRRMDPLGNVLTLAGSPGLTNSTDGPAAAARFNHPADVAVDGSGAVYVADAQNHTIRKLGPDGTVSTLAGSPGLTGTNNGAGNAARFNYPIGLAVDGSNNVYVADYNNHAIRRITPAGVVSTFAGLAGTSGTANGTGSVARFKNPTDVALDAAGNVYVADYGNATLRRVTPAGAVTLLAGNPGTFGFADGQGTNARFRGLLRLALDESGQVYATDSGYHTVRKVTPGGRVTTVAGKVDHSSVVDGMGIDVRFNTPEGIAVLPSGRLYVGSFQENVIQAGLPADEAPFFYIRPQSSTNQEGFVILLTSAAAGTAPIAYQWWKDGVPVPNGTNAALAFTPVTPGQSGQYSVTASNAFGVATVSNVVLTVIPALPLAEALEAPAQAWDTGGAAAWFGQSVQSWDGADAARSGSLAAGQQSWIETTVTGPGTAAFWWRRSANATLTLAIGAADYASLPVASEWQQVVVPLGSGTVALRWTVTSTGEDGYGLVDQFVFTQAPFIQVQPQGQSTFPGSNVTFTVSAIGPGPLSYQWEKEETPISGARLASHTVTAAQAADAGLYRVRVRNRYGVTASSNALLAVLNTQAVTYGRSGVIAIPASGTATPYPSILTVTNFPGAVLRVEITLSNFTHALPPDVDILLAGPAGQKVMVMSDAGDATPASGAALRFSDFAEGVLGSFPVVSGTYLPTDVDPTESLPGTPRPYAPTLAAYDGTNPNGDWALSVQDDTGGDSGTITGWGLSLYKALPPVITQGPESLLVGLGESAAFSVAASSSLPPGYQWLKNGLPIPGATNRTHSILAAGLNDAGSYSVVVSNATGSATSSVARLLVADAAGVPVAFADDFEVDSTAAWLVFPGSTNGVADYTAGFAHDYGGFFSPFLQTNIPPAPASAGASTRGLRLTVNKNNAVAATAGVSLYPRAQFFSGPHALKFDLWVNYPGGSLEPGASGTTEHAAFGLNHAGTRVNWDAANSTPSDGVWFSVTGEGGATDDYRAYVGNPAARPTLLPFSSSGLAAAGATSPDHTNAVFTNLFPAPLFETPGAPGKRWVQVEVSQDRNNVLTWKMNGGLLARRTNTTVFTNGNIMLAYMDLLPNIASPASNAFVLFDNVRVELDPAAYLPVISAQPAHQTVYVGESASFTVGVSGQGPFRYSWLRNGAPLPGATNATLSLTNLQLADSGTLSVLVSNAVGGVLSADATLSVNNQPPGFTIQPVSLSVVEGGAARFSVLAYGTAPLRFQWQRNGADLPGENGSTLDVSPVGTTSAGAYRVILTNIAGSVTSSPALLFVLPTASKSPSSPYLVRDINTALNTSGSSPARFVQVGGVAFFTANDGFLGEELWKTDGTVQGTVLVKDIFPGSSSSLPANLVNANGTLLFTANDGVNGVELWRSDGTEAGTIMVTNLRSGSLPSSPADLLNLNGTVFFSANGATNGTELWKTDGTEAGTVLVADIRPGIGSSTPANLVEVAGTLFFTASDATTGVELWKSDGTAAGTMLVADLRAGSLSSFPSTLVNVAGTLFFTANNGTNGTELWKSDGTAAGTQLVKDILAGSTSSSPNGLTALGPVLLFSANDQTNGFELWKSDGTTLGTVLVKNIAPGSASSNPNSLTVAGASLFFAANNSTNGIELWKSDGTPAGTLLVKDIQAGSGSSSPALLTAVGNALFFRATTTTNGNELWRSDGTSSGTVLVREIYSGTASSSPTALAAFNDLLLFSANNGTNGAELWRSDGTLEGTLLLSDVAGGTSGSSASLLVALGDTLLFRANNGSSGLELWKSDGSEAGTFVVKDIRAGPSGSSPSGLFNAGAFVLFAANDGTNGTELWRSDATSEGTFLVKDMAEGAGSSAPSGFIDGPAVSYFIASDPASGRELRQTDGTDTGTGLVVDLTPGPDDSSLGTLATLGSTLCFTYTDVEHGTELWTTDGTPQGTRLLRDILPGPDSSYPGTFIRIGSVLFFTATDGESGIELWKTDGTPDGTVLVKDIAPGSNDSVPSGFANINGVLCFVANDGTHGSELWRSDGTGAGTVLVKDINPTGSSSPNNLVNVNGIAYFAASNGTQGSELWRSDSTEAGTYLVKDIRPGNPGASLANLINANGLLYFTANDGLTGNELWCSDGTAGGTHLVRDLAPAAASSNPANLTRTRSRLFFTASTPAEGQELFAITLSNQPPADLFLDQAGIAENLPPGAHVGNLFMSDPDSGDMATYSLISGPGDTHNALFAIAGQALITTATFDFEAAPPYSIRIRAADGAGAFVEKPLLIIVEDRPEAPQAVAGGPYTNHLGSPLRLDARGSLDPDAGDTIAAYSWDLNNDGIFGDAIGAAPVLAANVLANLGLWIGVHPIALRVTDTTGAQAIDATTLTVIPPILILSQPLSQTNYSHATVTFSVTAAGDFPLSYQWRKDGVALADDGRISGAASPMLVISNIFADAGSYQVVIQDAFGSVTSAVATLTIWFPPEISAQPADQTATSGTTATMSIAASGLTTAVHFTWRHAGTNIFLDGPYPGSAAPQTSILTLTNVQMTQAGAYDVIVTNLFGSVTSRVALLTITPASLILTNPVVTPTVLDLTLIGTTGTTWNVERALQPSGPWTNLQTLVIPTNGQTRFLDTNPPSAGGFYRGKQP